ncbi:MAG: GreA/GreB family elongation factor [Chloroflexi bacterium]|nr:GreA/GreB family elongation factor [Chloroflexota bacterium]
MTRLDVRLTPEGRQQLEGDLEALEAERREVSERLLDARAGGNDPSENLDLRDAMDALQMLESRINDLRALLAAAEPLEAGTVDGIARLGATVKVKHADGEVASYILVSPAEADPRKGRISAESPIGRAVVGTKKGDEVVAETPRGLEKLIIQGVK